MFIPIGDEPNAKATPYATYGLIALNMYIWVVVCWPRLDVGVNPLDPDVLGYLATMRRATGIPSSILLQETSAYDLLTFSYGFRPNHPSVVALFASLFLHGSWMHVLGNMLFLWIFGDNIEARIGAKKYLALYVACGVLATLFYAAFRYGSPLPLIGASGAISGILGAYFVWFGKNRVRVLMVWVIFIQIIHVPARWVLGFYLLIENLLPFVLQSSPTSPTAYGAHIGGFFAGALYALAYNHHEATGRIGGWTDWLRELRRAPHKDPANLGDEPPASGTSQGAGGGPSAQDVARAVDARDFGTALAQYAALDDTQRRGISINSRCILADVLTHKGDFALAAQMLKRCIADGAQGAKYDLARAHLRLGLLQLKGMAKPFAAREHLLTVLDLLPNSDEAEAASEALRAMD